MWLFGYVGVRLLMTKNTDFHLRREAEMILSLTGQI